MSFLGGLFGPPDVDALLDRGNVRGLVKALSYKKDASVRQKAAKALGEIGDAAAVPALSEALHDKEWKVRRNAISALGAIGDPAGVPALTERVGRDIWHLRCGAARALGAIGDPAGIPVLSQQLDHKRGDVRESAVGALGEIGDPAAIPALTKALGDSYRGVRRAAAKALGRIGDPAVIPPLTEALDDAEFLVRTAAVEALGETGDSTAVPVLIEALGDSADPVREYAAEGLGEIGDPAAVPALSEALEDESPRVREAAADALEDIGWQPGRDADGAEYWIARREWDQCAEIGAPAVEPLAALLQDEDSSVRQHAVEALGKIGVPAVPALTEALKDEDRDVRTAAAELLRAIGDSAIPALVEALGDEDPSARETAAGALDELGWEPGLDETGAAYWIARREWDQCVEIGAPAVEPLAALLQDRDPSVRQEAAGALGRIGDARAVEPLVDVLKVEDVAAVRKRAREALGRIGEATGVELPDLEQPSVGTIEDVTQAKAQGHVAALIQALRKHHNFLVRQRAARALGELGHERAVEPLFAALDDDAVNVQNNAAGALVEIGGPEVISRFIGMMFHATGPRKQAIANALKQITGEDFGTNSYSWQEWWKGQRKE